EAARHAEERRHADPSGDPDLARLEEPPVRERTVRPLDDRLRARLEPPERARVVADRLDGDPERRLVTGGGDRGRVELVADLARSDREHLTLERDVEGALLRAERRRAEAHEDELPGLERERLCPPLDHD